MNQKESILIVDDDESTCRSLRLIFGKKGYETEIAGTAQEALEKIKKRSFNVTLIDIRLPDMEGTVLLGKLKKVHPEMVCIVITGYASIENTIMAIKLGSNGYFVKPLVMEEVTYRLEDALDKQRLERKLKESEKKYRTLYESSKDGIVFSDMEGNLLDANQAFLDMLGYKIEEIRRLSYYDLTPKKWHKITTDLIKDQTMVRGYSKEYEKEYIKKDGTTLPITIRSWLVKDNQQKPVGTWAIVRDITERKQAEEKLLKKQYYLTKAQEMGLIGTWELDIQKNILIWTDENYKIFGVPLGTEMNYELFLNCIHPDDRDYVNEKWSAGLNHEPYDIEHRLIVNDKVKWVREKADIEFDKEGTPIMAIGFTQDITERKKAEEQIKDSEKRLKIL
ncbi:unnamed protein product, partial [marine sediment metagenome]